MQSRFNSMAEKLNAMTYQLRSHLTERGLLTSGNKKTLIEQRALGVTSTTTTATTSVFHHSLRPVTSTLRYTTKTPVRQHCNRLAKLVSTFCSTNDTPHNLLQHKRYTTKYTNMSNSITKPRIFDQDIVQTLARRRQGVQKMTITILLLVLTSLER